MFIKKIIFIISCLISVSLLVVVEVKKQNEVHYTDTKKVVEEKVPDIKNISTVFKIDKLKNGDAKFYNDKYIATQVDGKFMMIDFQGNVVKTYDDIQVKWFSVEPGDKTIVYSNVQKQLGILVLDDNLNIVKNQRIATYDNLVIDPTIININGTYYVTYTSIDGIVNNKNAQKENGNYTVELLKSDDLENFSYVGKVMEDKHNLEDIVAMKFRDRYLLIYERETVDRGDSTLEEISSENGGVTWSQPKVICEPDGDNELGNILTYNDKYYVYYSSDTENRGASYDGAEIYVKVFDRDFDVLEDAQRIDGVNSALLYDVKKSGDSVYFIYTEEYSTDSNLVLLKCG